MLLFAMIVWALFALAVSSALWGEAFNFPSVLVDRRWKRLIVIFTMLVFSPLVVVVMDGWVALEILGALGRGIRRWLMAA